MNKIMRTDIYNSYGNKIFFSFSSFWKKFTFKLADSKLSSTA